MVLISRWVATLLAIMYLMFAAYPSIPPELNGV